MVIKANPDHTELVAGEARKPAVIEVIRSTRFTRDIKIQFFSKTLCRTGLCDIMQNVINQGYGCRVRVTIRQRSSPPESGEEDGRPA